MKGGAAGGPVLGYVVITAGIGTSMHDIIKMAGGTNLAAVKRESKAGRLVDDEWIIAMAPDVIVTDAGEISSSRSWTTTRR